MWRFWLVVVLTIFADLGSKKYIFEKLLNTPAQRFELVPGWLSFTLHINKGAVWGIGGGKPVLIIAVTAVIIPIVIYLAHTSQKSGKSFLPLLGFGMLLGGALGNLYDRVFTSMQLRGYPQSYYGVRDFVDFRIPGVYNWPVFNVADIAIVLGVVIFILWSLSSSGSSSKKD